MSRHQRRARESKRRDKALPPVPAPSRWADAPPGGVVYEEPAILRGPHQWLVFQSPMAAHNGPMKLIVAGSPEDPSRIFREWLEAQVAITEWRYTDSILSGSYFKGRVHGRPFELQVDGPDSHARLRRALEVQLAVG